MADRDRRRPGVWLVCFAALVAGVAALRALVADDAPAAGRIVRGPVSRPAASATVAPVATTAGVAPAGSRSGPLAASSPETPIEATPAEASAPPVAPAAVTSEGLKTPYGRVRRVKGVVVDADDRPRADVVVTLVGGQSHAPGEDGWERRRAQPTLVGALRGVLWSDLVVPVGSARSGLDGEFDIPLAADRLRQLDALTATAAVEGALAMALVRPVPRVKDEVLDLGRLVLRPLPRVEVVARSGGAPVAGAEVRVRLETTIQGAARGYSPTEHLELEGRTDEAGVAAFDLRGEEVQVWLEADGLANASRDLGTIDGPARVEVELLPGLELTGRVVSAADGEPLGAGDRLRRVASAPYVSVSTRDPRVSGSGATAGDDGRFRVRGLAAGVDYTLRVSDRTGRFAPAKVAVTTPCPEVEVRLEPAGAIVVGLELPPALRRGLPDRDTRLSAERHQPDGSWAWVEAIDSEHAPVGVDLDRRRLGRDERLLLGLAPGTYRVRADRRGTLSLSEPVEVRAGADARVKLKVEAGRRVRGCLLDAVGAPQAKVRLTLQGRTPRLTTTHHLTTDDRGRFQIDELAAEVTTLELSREGHQPRTVTLPADGELGDVRLEPATAVR